MASTDTPGERLRTLRKQLGLTGQAFAEAIGMTKSAVSYWEIGRVPLQRSACLAIERVFGASADWLMEGTGPMWSPAQSASGAIYPALVVRPLITSPYSFEASGKIAPPPPDAPMLGLPRDLVTGILDSLGGDEEDLFFVLHADVEMEPTLKAGDWVLVHCGLAARESVESQGLYLVRLRECDPPHIRRLAVDPVSEDLLVGSDRPERIPLRVGMPTKDWPSRILGRVCWNGTLRLF